MPDKVFSEIENRAHQQQPVFTASGLLAGTFADETERYLADQFILRDECVEAKTVLDAIAGKKEFNGVYLTGGRLIERVDAPEEAKLTTNIAAVKHLASIIDTPLTLGKKEFNGVYLTGGRLIERVDAPEEAKLTTNIAAVKHLASIIDTPLTLALAPTAADVYKETLPAGAPSADQQALLERIARETGVPNADLASALRSHKDEYIFYRTDHHWTTLGAYYGAEALLESLGKDIAPLSSYKPERVTEDFNGTLYSSSGVRTVKPDAIDIYVPQGESLGKDIAPLSSYKPERVTEDFNGTLYSSSGVRTVKPDAIDIYVPQGDAVLESWRNGAPEEEPLYDRTWLDKKDKYSMFLGGNQPLAVIRTGNPGGKLLLVRDSYADCLAPFLMEQYSEIHLFDARYFKQPLSSYIAQHDIDETVLLFSLKNFIADTSLQMVCK